MPGKRNGVVFVLGLSLRKQPLIVQVHYMEWGVPWFIVWERGGTSSLHQLLMPSPVSNLLAPIPACSSTATVSLATFFFLLASSWCLFFCLVGVRPTFEERIQRCKEKNAAFQKDLMKRGCGMWSCILMHVMEAKSQCAFHPESPVPTERVLKTRSTG